MKTKTFMLPFIVAVVFLLVSVVSASELATNLNTEFNSVHLSDTTDMSVESSDTVPVRVTFVALQDASDVKVKAELEGLREDVSESTNRFDIVAGRTYTKLLNLELPSDADKRIETLTLYVSVVNQGNRTEKTYTLTLQRESYDLSVLSVDYSTNVLAGDVFPVSVVLKNTGFNRLDDNFVVASIPQLGISSRGYAGDLIAVEDYIDYDDEEDSVQKVVYLQIPRNAPSGVYEMVITVQSDDLDARTTVTRLISVGEKPDTTTVLATTKSRDVNAGETAEYELLIVNADDTTKVYTVNAVSSRDLIISVPAVVAVGAGDSKTVTISATVPENTPKGTYTFSVDVDGKQVVFAANVVNDDNGISTGNLSSSMVGLTVVLVIVFIVLLVVLIILISRKDEETTEEVETSYY